MVSKREGHGGTMPKFNEDENWKTGKQKGALLPESERQFIFEKDDKRGRGAVGKNSLSNIPHADGPQETAWKREKKGEVPINQYLG